MHLFFILLSSLFSITYGVAIVSRTQSVPAYAIGPVANLVVSNKMIAPDGFLRSATVAGGTFPAPLIQATKGDRFAINVINELTDPEMWLSTSIHWHGIFQNEGTNPADGTAFVTQCPITQNNSFLYQFDVANQSGTFWYHSHYSSQICDGLEGPLVIYDPDDPYKHLYDIDDETTVITLSDWYHIAAPVLAYIIGPVPNSTLINGAGRYSGGPNTDLSVVNVQHGKRYRLRLVAISCEPNFIFSIDGHNMTIIETDGQLTEPVVVDSLQIFAGQRYSVILNATQPIGNYWIRALPSTGNATFAGGLNSAILRYYGAPIQEPTTQNTTSVIPLVQQNLHALLDPAAPGVPEYGKADINLVITVNLTDGVFYMNGVRFRPPTVPVLLQILSGAQQATNLLPAGSVYVLGGNKVVEVTVQITGLALGGPHPIHLHGHAFSVIQYPGDNTTNYVNPVRRDVTTAGNSGQQMVIRYVTDNHGPWFLHCHIDWHLETGFAVVLAEDIGDLDSELIIPPSWNDLCPKFDALSTSQLGAVNAFEQAANLTTLLVPQ